MIFLYIGANTSLHFSSGYCCFEHLLCPFCRLVALRHLIDQCYVEAYNVAWTWRLHSHSSSMEPHFQVPTHYESLSHYNLSAQSSLMLTFYFLFPYIRLAVYICMSSCPFLTSF